MGTISERLERPRGAGGGGGGALPVAQVDGLEQVLKKINKAIRWNEEDKKQLRKINRQVVSIYVRNLKRGSNRIIDAQKTIKVKGRDDIKPGTLRRSVGTWTPEKGSTKVLGGPKYKGGSGKAQSNNDAWFAHIVEEGDFSHYFGGKNKSHPNYKKFEKAKKATQARMQRMLLNKLRAEFERFMS
jgi:hypothetical protein